jgi:cytochrome c oxidase accessory protein FixG
MTLASPDQVLTTLRKDGSRQWMRPRVSKGRFLMRRRVVAYFLMTLFFVLPFLTINGKPAILLDIGARRFTILGYTFLPTDTLLLALFMLFVFVSIFLFTAVFGRLWCGWACPQTVYMEFLYRPLERLFEGTFGRGGEARSKSAARKVGYFFAALAVTAIPAHTFLAYFVGVDQLSQWVRGSPLEHPTAFLVMSVTTVLMFFDFYYFREQLCVIACPYGRFQSVLLDRVSLIVSYDKRRGEPRGKKRAATLSLPIAEKGGTPDSELTTQHSAGDCVDCRMCVTTCPTGIDIRDGLQMECVNCTQCIDACDAVMDRIGSPRGLIRYSSQGSIEGEKVRRFRFRVVFYPLILAILATVWIVVFVHKGAADITVLRTKSVPFATLPSGNIANPFRLKIMNRTDAEVRYTFELGDISGGSIIAEENPLAVAAGQSKTIGFTIEAPANVFSFGMCDAHLHVTDGKAFSVSVPVRLIGPFGDANNAGETKPIHTQGARP